MPGALTWDPTPAGGSQSTARGAVNPTADGATSALQTLVLGAWNAAAALTNIVCPTVLTTAAITAAAQAMSLMGGGIVQLPAGIIPLQAPGLPLLQGVKYRGMGVALNFDVTPNAAGGTLLTGDGTFPAFYCVTTTAGASTAQATLGDLPFPAITVAQAATFTHNCGVEELMMSTFSWGIKAGALYNPGISMSTIRNVHAHGCTYWGFWFENCGTVRIEYPSAFYNVTGQFMFTASGTNVYIPGDSVIVHPNTAKLGALSRGFVVGARKSSSINDVTVIDLVGQGQTTTSVVTQAITITGLPKSLTTSTIAVNNCTGYINDGGAASNGVMGCTMTITALGAGGNGRIYPGMTISGSGLVSGIGYYVLSQISGTPNGIGVYAISVPINLSVPQTLNVGGYLTVGGGGIPVVDMVLTGTGIGIPDVQNEGTYIVGENGDNVHFYTSEPVAVGSTTITASYSTFTVTDATKFAVGCPIYFDNAINGVRTNQTYFVRSMSAATGAATLTISDNKGWRCAKGFSGNSGVNIKYAGHAVAEFVGEDWRSYVYNSMITRSDTERGGTTKMIFQGCQSGGYYVIGNVINSAASSMVIRACSSGIQWNFLHPGPVMDIDRSVYLCSGYAVGSYIQGNGLIMTGWGVDATTGAMSIAFDGGTSPTFQLTAGGLQIANKALLTPRITYSVTGAISKNYNNVTFIGAAGQTLSLVDPVATNLGQVVSISNPTANAVTITTVGGVLNLIGDGAAAATTYTLAARTTKRFTMDNDGLVYFIAVG